MAKGLLIGAVALLSWAATTSAAAAAGCCSTRTTTLPHTGSCQVAARCPQVADCIVESTTTVASVSCASVATTRAGCPTGCRGCATATVTVTTANKCPTTTKKPAPLAHRAAAAEAEAAAAKTTTTSSCFTATTTSGFPKFCPGIACTSPTSCPSVTTTVTRPGPRKGCPTTTTQTVPTPCLYFCQCHTTTVTKTVA